jgi:hypothetical protein
MGRADKNPKELTALKRDIFYRIELKKHEKCCSGNVFDSILYTFGVKFAFSCKAVNIRHKS